MSTRKKPHKRKPKPRLRFRLIPVTMCLAAMLLLFKTSDALQDGMRLSALFYSNAVAEDKPAPEAAKKEGPKKDDKKEEPKEEAAAKDKKEEPAKSDKEKTDGKESAEKPKEEHGEAKSEEAAAESEGHGEEKKEELPANVSLTPPAPMGDSGLREGDRRFSPEEVKLLEQLSKRRQELGKWEGNIQVKEGLLTVTEKRVDEKLSQIESLKTELSDLLTQYNQQENAKIKSLVKIYENMKPRDAAGIFDEVEMPILLLIIDQMSEKKAAPTLAAMDPKKAKQLTVELAEQRRAQGEKLKRISQATAPSSGAPPGAAPQPAPPKEQTPGQ